MLGNMRKSTLQVQASRITEQTRMLPNAGFHVKHEGKTTMANL